MVDSEPLLEWQCEVDYYMWRELFVEIVEVLVILQVDRCIDGEALQFSVLRGVGCLDKLRNQIKQAFARKHLPVILDNCVLKLGQQETICKLEECHVSRQRIAILAAILRLLEVEKAHQ